MSENPAGVNDGLENENGQVKNCQMKLKGLLVGYIK